VTFGKHGIALHMHARVTPIMMVTGARRDGTRLILTGNAPLTAGGEKMQIELKLRNGEIRLDDVVDPRGRSILYERFESKEARRLGVTTIGDVFRLVLDLKPCRV
jgi:hypothetical protein